MTPEQELELAEAEAAAVDQPDAIDPASPLAKAAAEQTGDVLEIQTPTGPWRGTREGVPVLSAEEVTGAIKPTMMLPTLQTAASLAQGGALGLAGPVAGANAVKDRLREYLGKKLRGEQTESLSDTYQRAADSTRQSLNNATDAVSPSARIPFTQTKVPLYPMLGALMTSGPAGLGASAATRALGSGFTGVLQAGGESDFDPASTVAGGALAAGAGRLTEGVVSGLGRAAAPMLEKMSRSNALKSMGLYAGIANLGKRLGYESADEIGDFAAAVRDNGDIIKPFGTSEGVAERVSEKLPQLGQRQGAIISQADADAIAKGAPFDFGGAAQEMEAAIKPRFGGNPLSDAASGPAMTQIEATRATQPLNASFSRANELKQHLYGDIPWNAPNMGQSTSLPVDMQRDAYGALRKKLISEVGRVSGPEAGAQLTDVNREIALLKDVQHLSTNDSMRALGRRGSLTSGMAGLGGMGLATAGGAGTPEAMAIGALTSYGVDAARSRLPSALTYGQKALGQWAGGVTGETAGQAASFAANQSRAVDSLSEYLGRPAKKDEAAKIHFQAGNADPQYQDR